MVAHVVYVFCALSTVLYASHDAADNGLAGVFFGERSRIREKRFQKFHRYDLLAFEVDRIDARNADRFHHPQMGKVILSECHPETHALQPRQVFHERLHLLVEEQIAFARAGDRIVEGEMDASFMHNWRRLDPFAFAPVPHLLRHLADVYFRIEIGGERFIVAAGIRVENVHETHLVEIFLERSEERRAGEEGRYGWGPDR